MSWLHRYTVENNIGATHNVLCGIVESGLDVHLVHLGTMGVYGYGNSGGAIPEGYIDVVLPGNRAKKILHPAYPGSIYHTTKCLDALLFQFYAKNDLLRLTDLHQGIVWGTNTQLTSRDERLINRFDYDGEYGTVLNRFLMQVTGLQGGRAGSGVGWGRYRKGGSFTATSCHSRTSLWRTFLIPFWWQAACDIPLTVYGTGGQTRAFIHISDTARCVRLAVSNAPSSGSPVEILNQVSHLGLVRTPPSGIRHRPRTRAPSL